jgi:hypothetical protein
LSASRIASVEASWASAALAPSELLPSSGLRDSGDNSWITEEEPFDWAPSLPSAVPPRMPPEPEVVSETLAGAK